MAQTTKLELDILNPRNKRQLEFTFRLRNENAQFYFDSNELDWDKHVTWMLEKYADIDYYFYLIRKGNNMVGTIAFRYEGEHCRFLQNLCVDKPYRGQGIAKKVIKMLMKPKMFIMAQVKPDNKKVIRMYQELGFWKVK